MGKFAGILSSPVFWRALREEQSRRESIGGKVHFLKTATSPYEILNVTQDADAADVRQAYRLLAKQYHPDVSTNRDNGAASGMFQQIQEAYKLLSDAPKRKRYDAMRRMVAEDANDAPDSGGSKGQPIGVMTGVSASGLAWL